jgi:phospholipase/carboxylesterase
MSTTLPGLSGPSVPPLSGQPPAQLVILLHGLGSDGNDLIGLVPYWQQLLPEAQFVAPNAPEPFDMAPVGYQWFSLREFSTEERVRGVRTAAPALDAFINQQMHKFKVSPERIALVGFSQGTMMSLFVAPRWQSPVGAVIGFSGALIDPESLEREVRARPPVLLVHGDRDDIVPVDMLEVAGRTLMENGFSVKAVRRPGLGHGIDMEGIRLAGEFLQQHLAGAVQGE